MFLADVGSERLALLLVHPSRIDIQARSELPPQWIAEPVRHRVIHGDIMAKRIRGRVCDEVFDSMAERSGRSQSAGLHVVFHVVAG